MKTAVIIGGTGGVGSALVVKLRKDYKVITLSSRESSNKNHIKCDLESVDQIEKSIQVIGDRFQKIDLLINTAGIANYDPIEEFDNKRIIETFMINTIGPAIFIKDLLPIMSESGLVVNIGSGAGTIPMRGRSIYCSSKFGLRGLSLSLSEEYKDKSPQFCLITLGSTLTEFGPLSLAEKKSQAKSGKVYFPVEWVAEKLVEIIKDSNRESEIVLYPSEHGFGNWKKP